MLTRENIQIVSWNINSDRRVEILDTSPYKYTANAFSDFSILKRFPMITLCLDYLRNIKKVNIFALQEIEDSILPHFIHHFKSKNLSVLSLRYNQSKMAFNFIFSYDPTVYTCVNERQICLTKSGNFIEEKVSKEEKLIHNLDSEFERSSQFIVLENIKTKEKFIIINNHFGLSNKHRLLAAETLCKYLLKENMPMILVGDFNQFDEESKKSELFMSQIDIFRKNHFKWMSECLQSQNPKSTFVAFPYDINRFLSSSDFIEYEKLKEIGDYSLIRNFFTEKIEKKDIPLVSTSLDGVYGKNITTEEKSYSCKALFFAKGARIKPTPDEGSIQKIAVESYKKECIFPSDHLPLLVRLSYSP
jgi:endonuclease/exonuclease/phosphatase family metal-dependent hydrolase